MNLVRMVNLYYIFNPLLFRTKDFSYSPQKKEEDVSYNSSQYVSPIPVFV
jgi:hypothetical protein